MAPPTPGEHCQPTWRSVIGSNGGLNHYRGEYDYTSGWLETPTGFQYGRYEIRASIPNDGHLLWPAFWLFGGTEFDNGHSASGEIATEIDIFEFTIAPHTYTRNQHSYFMLNDYIDWYGDPANDPELLECTEIWNAACNYHIVENDPADPSDDQIQIHHPFEEELAASLDLSAMHTYRLDWTPKQLTWYIDDIPISAPQYKHVPSNLMHVIINMALPNWMEYGPSDLGLPKAFEIDWVRVSKMPQKDFTWAWGNGGHDKIDWWTLDRDSQYLSGNFDGVAGDELFTIDPSVGISHLMNYNEPALTDAGWGGNYDTAKWNTRLSTGGDNIDGFNLNGDDTYLTGNFIVESGAQKDELMLLNANTGWAALMNFQTSSGNAWSTSWLTGNDMIHWWTMNSDDQYVVGDFDNDDQDELLAISNASGHVHLMEHDGSDWTSPWVTSGSGIANWSLATGDKFLAADFDGDGRDELLAINASSGRVGVLSYDGSDWNSQYADNSGIIHWWYLNADDTYVVGNFDDAPGDEFLAVNRTSSYSHLMTFTASASPAWSTIWSNEGRGHLHDADTFLSGRFDTDAESELLSIGRGKKWAYLRDFEQPGETLEFQ